MATANDRAVLQTIFNPSTPFEDIPGLDEEGEDGTQEESE